ncbi:MAG TPA: hypothetical protein VF746_19295 [Longimicrobium sp.]
MPITRGSTFILTRATGSVPHLWVVLSDPAGDPPEVVILSLTTLRPHSDETVVLNPGDHPFVQHPTCAYFSDARIVTVQSLERALRLRQAIPQPDMDAAIVERMRDGLFQSPFTIHAIRERCRVLFGRS